MNVRLQYNTALTAGIFYNGSMSMNNYNIKLSMITNTYDPEEHNIAYERVKYFINKICESAVFINQSHEEACKLYTQAGIRLITLPEEPIDQIIGMMLYSKLNAIMEGRIDIVEVEISSELGDHMIYFHCEEESLGPFIDDDWWRDSNTVHCNTKIVFGDEAMKYRAVQWKDLNLDWPEFSSNPEEEEESDFGNTIIFTDFNRNETK